MMAMASADLKEELNCSICLNVYTDPVTLRCGHNFCCFCIDRVLNLQKRSGVYTCPECRKRFHSRPVLKKNITLSRIAERFHSQSDGEGASGISCTYCDFPTPAIKTCVQCETSMCNNHLKKHNNSVKHMLIPPTTDLGQRKCPVHKKTLEYYCTEDAACICVSCRLDGEHLGHMVESLEDAAKARKVQMRPVLDRLVMDKEDIERDLKRQLDLVKKIPKKSTDLTERVIALFRDIVEKMQELEKKVLNEITLQDAKITLSAYDLIHQMEAKRTELTRKIRHIEELCRSDDPLAVLQEQESECESSEEEEEDPLTHQITSLDEGAISEMLYKGLADIIIGVNGGIPVKEPEDIRLDVSTASNNLQIQDDCKALFKTEVCQERPETKQRFYESQVMSSQSFSAGRHYWDVETSKTGEWNLGVCYQGTVRGVLADNGGDSYSWGLQKWTRDECIVKHQGQSIKVPHRILSRRFRVCLDYEAGQISFYELGVPIRHLHTFNTTFTEPIYATFCLSKRYSMEKNWIKING